MKYYIEMFSRDIVSSFEIFNVLLYAQKVKGEGKNKIVVDFVKEGGDKMMEKLIFDEKFADQVEEETVIEILQLMMDNVPELKKRRSKSWKKIKRMLNP